MMFKTHVSDFFWVFESHTQRMSVQDWRQILLDKGDSQFVNGRLRQFVAKRLGYGVVEVSLKPLKEDA